MISDKPIPFTGELLVEGDAFELNAERFIWRGDSVSFHLSCSESDFGKSTANGTAKRNSIGKYICEDLKLRYESDNRDTPAKIHFNRIELVENGDVLFVKGLWEQVGESFDFEGMLPRFNP